jgi:hypothetical protein
VLTADTVAQEWVRTEGWRKYDSAAELVELICQYKVSKGLGNSSISEIDVAEAVLRLYKKPEPVDSPEQAQWQSNLSEGTTRDTEKLRRIEDAMVAQQVTQMDYRKFAANRRKFGLERDLVEFLSGN